MAQLRIQVDENTVVTVKVMADDREAFRATVYPPRTAARYNNARPATVSWQSIGESSREITEKVAEALMVASGYAGMLDKAVNG